MRLLRIELRLALGGLRAAFDVTLSVRLLRLFLHFFLTLDHESANGHSKVAHLRLRFHIYLDTTDDLIVNVLLAQGASGRVAGSPPPGGGTADAPRLPGTSASGLAAC